MVIYGGALGGCAEASTKPFEQREAGTMRVVDGSAPDAGAPDFEQVYPLFRHHCSGSRCHNQEPAPVGLRLANPDVHVAKADAVARAARIHQRINDKSDPMPPTGRLDEEVRTALSRWAEAVAR